MVRDSCGVLETPPKSENWEYHGGLWCRGNEMIVVGCDLQQEVCAQAHATLYASHFGQERTLNLARRFFWWSKMK